jgi:S1-C subfamily serine protease
LPFSSPSRSLRPAAARRACRSPVEGLDPKERPASFRDLSKRLMPAVVNISTSKTVAPEGMPTFPEGLADGDGSTISSAVTKTVSAARARSAPAS